ncbi:MAG TPA: DUF4214 domain-containing protein, partial [Iamia sp.]|nr:DUF4214 domain-containing protein [Iamia sp.]
TIAALEDAAAAPPLLDPWAVVYCTDTAVPNDVEPFLEAVRRGERHEQRFVGIHVYNSLPCAFWPDEAAERYAGPWDATTSAPLLIVSNTGDAATPYDDAVRGSRRLGNARLLTVEGFGHVSANAESTCANEAIDAYLLGTVPAKGARCAADARPFGNPAPAPAVEITDGPTGVVAEDVASFAFTVDPADDAVVECRLDEGAWSACTSPATVSDLANGEHTFEVRASRPGTATAVASRTWTVSVPVPRGDDESWLTALHTDLIGRAPSEGELAVGLARLASGTTRAVVARELTSSETWVASIVRRFYTDTLDRQPDAAGVTFWIAQIRSGRRTVAQVAALFYSSPEYYETLGGADDEPWVQDLFAKLLHRPADTAGLAYWTERVATHGRTDVARQLYGSYESRLDRVGGLYLTLLDRPADPAGAAYWAGRIARAGDLALVVWLVTSAEYGRLARTRFP